MPPARSANPFRTLIAHRNFRIFLAGQTLSLVGTWMQTVAQGWLALELSNSAFLVGVVSAAQSFPVLVLSLYGGVVADRHDKLRLVKIAQVLLLVQAALLWWFTVSKRLTIDWLIILSTLNGLISAFEIPARQSFIVELVQRDDLVEAIALNSGAFNLARVIGPMVAALVIGTLGLAWCFALNALSYFAVLASLFTIRVAPWKRPDELGSSIEGMLEGFRYMRDTPLVNVLVRVVGVTAIFGLAYLAMMPVVARNVIHTGATGYGVLMTFVGVGAFAGALSMAALSERHSRGKLFIWSTYIFAIAIVVFTFVHAMVPASAVLAVVGFAMLLNGSLANGLMQAISPDELRGRVVSAYVFVYVGLVPIGSFIVGALAKGIGVEWALCGMALFMLGYSWWAFTHSPALGAVEL